jgi:hypothetical protein
MKAKFLISIFRERLQILFILISCQILFQKGTKRTWQDFVETVPDPRPLIPDPCFIREYARSVMQGQVELFFAVREVIREECYM